MIITKNDLEEVPIKFKEYRKGKSFEEEQLLADCLRLHPNSTERKEVALKCAIIDVTNSTNLSRYKSYISIVDLVNHILKITNIDKRIKEGDRTVVDEIAKTGKINLFSFATKYCCYHSLYVYGKDNFSIYDNKLCEKIPEICQQKEYRDKSIQLNNKYKYNNIHKLGDIKQNTIDKFRKNVDFNSYQTVIDKLLEGIEVCENKRWKFDKLFWM